MSRWAVALLSLAIGAALGSECTRRQAACDLAQRAVVVVDTLVSRALPARDSVVIRHDTIFLAQSTPGTPGAPGAQMVELPITQAHYATSEAEVWVSGFRPRLDSLRVFMPRLEPAAASMPRSKPRRWHLGVTAGAAVTPAGVQPCVSVGITYSFFSF